MRKVLLPLFLLFIISYNAYNQQVPFGINYQTIVRDALGLPVASKTLQLKISLKESSPSGTLVYQEEFLTQSNQFGLVNLIIGKGTRIGGSVTNFNQIDWSSSNYYIQVEINNNGTYLSIGVSQFQSVPYSLTSDNTLKIQNKEISNTAPFAGQFLRYNGTTQKWEPSNLAGANGGTVTTISGLNPIIINGNGSLDPQISILQAGPGQDGYLSSIDWTNFNDKIGITSLAGGDLSGTFQNFTVKGLNGIALSNVPPSNGQVLRYNSISQIWEASNASAGTVTSVTGIGSIVVTNGGAEPIISISEASSISGGALSATDYLKFYNKQDALIAGSNITISGNTIQSAGDIPITLSPLGGTTITGSYPNFSISTPLPTSNTNIIGINGATVTGVFPNFTVDAPLAIPQTNIIGLGATSVTGTFPNFSINSPPATPITNLNGLNAATVSGLFPNFTIDVQIPSAIPLTSNTVGVSITGNNFEIGTASGTSLGLLSSVDYNRFMSKVATISGSNGITLNQDGNAYTIIGQTFTQIATTFTGANGVTVAGTGFNITVGGNNLLNSTSAFGGDLTGTYDNIQISGIAGVPITLGSATLGQALFFNGTGFVPASLPASQATTFTGSNGVTVAGTGFDITIGGQNLVNNAQTVGGDLNGNILAPIINNDAITTTKIIDAAVTAPKLANGILATVVGLNGITINQNGQAFSVVGQTFVQTPTTFTGANGVTIGGTGFNVTIGGVAQNLSSNTASVSVSGLNFEIGTASGTTFGLLNPTDFNTFNNKVSTVVGLNGITINQVGTAFSVVGQTFTQTQTTIIGINGATVTGGGFAYTVDGQNLQAGSGIQISGNQIINTSPNIPLTLIGVGATSVTGTANNFTITTPNFVAQATSITGANYITVAGTGFDLTIGGIAQNLTSNTASVSVSGLNFEIGTASGTSFGLLSPTDFTTFNNKVSTVVGLNGITINQVGNNYSISGVGQNQWISSSSDKIYTNSFVGIGTSNPPNPLSIFTYNNNGISINSIDAVAANAALYFNSTNTGPAQINSATISIKNSAGDRALQFFNSTQSIPAEEKIFTFLDNTTVPIISILNNGNMGLGSFITANEKLTVQGNTSVTGIGYFGTIIGNDLVGVAGSVVTVDGAGKLGIGTIPMSSSQWLNSGTDIYFNTGKVGVGTNTPLSEFHIQSNSAGTGKGLLLSGNNAAINLGDVFGTDPLISSTWHIDNKSGTFRIYSQPGLNLGGDSWFHIKEGGKVGIGQNYENPIAQLDVNGDMRIASTLTLSGLAGSPNNYLSVNTNGQVITMPGNVSSQWQNSGSDIYFNTGNVGMGNISNPTFPLDVSQGINLTHAKFGQINPVYIYSSSPGIGFNAFWNASNYIYGAGSTNQYAGIIAYNDGFNEFNFTLSQSPGNDGGVIGTLVNTLKITTNGIGIGGGAGIAPNEKLTVQGNSSVTGIGYFGTIIGNNLTGASGSVVTVDGVGRLGIGTLPTATSQWITNGADIYYNTGKVGIGDIPSNADLDIFSTLGAVQVIRSDDRALRFTQAAGGNYIQSGTATAGVPDNGSSADLIFSNIFAGNIYMVLQANTGNLGIGTAAPNQKLEVVGNVSATGIGYFGTIIGNNLTGASGSVVTVDGAGRLGIGTFPASSNQWISVGTDKIYTNSLVGLGVINPTYPLQVSSDLSRLALFQTTNTTDQSTVMEMRTQAAANGWLFGVGGAGNSQGLTSGQFYYQSELGNTDFVILNGTGKIGLGTTTPNEKLTVEGNSSVTGISFSSEIRINNTSGDHVSFINTNATGNSVNIFEFSTGRYNSNNNRSDAQWQVGLFQGTTPSDADGFSIWRNNLGQDLILNRQGNLGLGQIVPNERLTVQGNSSTTGTTFTQNLKINALANGVLSVDGAGNVVSTSIQGSKWSNNGSDIYYSSGNVGIGAAPGLAILDVYDASSSSQNIRSNTRVLRFAQDANANFIQSGTATAGVPDNGSSADLIFSSINDASRYMVLQGVTGNLGLGTASPSQRLTVQGNTTISGNITASGSVFDNQRFTTLSNGVLSVDGAGNVVLGNIQNNSTNWITTAGGITFTQDKVGIGTSVTGTAKLKVAGDASAGGMVLASQTFSNVMGTPNSSVDVSLFKQVIYIPSGTLNLKIKLNAFNYIGAAPSTIKVKIGAAAPISQPVSSDLENTEVDFINIDVSTVAGSYQTIEVLARSSLAAESVLVKSYTVSIQD